MSKDISEMIMFTFLCVVAVLFVGFMFNKNMDQKIEARMLFIECMEKTKNLDACRLAFSE